MLGIDGGLFDSSTVAEACFKVNAGASSGTRERPSQVVLSLSARGKRKGLRTAFKWKMLKFNAGEIGRAHV